MENIIDAVSYEENIIQLQLRNVPKHPMIIAKIFTILSECGVNVDMISQVMIEDAMQIEITLDEKYQKNLNDAIMRLKDEVKQLEIATNRKYFKIAVGGKLLETTPGAAAKVFTILGDNNIHFYQVTTSKRTISFIVDKKHKELAMKKLDEAFGLNIYEEIMAIFEGSAVALVLPMHEDGSIDYDGFRRQVQRMLDGGVQALLVNGTTGETATIHIDDEFKLLDITLEMAAGTGVKVIAGAGSNDTATALKKAHYAKEKGADAILVVTPYYNKTSQRGLIKHYTTVADAVDIPMILYNVPGRTGININVATVVELAKHKNIVAMKDATDNIAYAMEVLAKTQGMDFDMYSGCDDNILPFICAGGKGVISVLSNIYPRQTELLAQLALKGDLPKAQELAYALEPVCRYLFIDVNPIMPKAALARMNVCKPTLRLPLIETTEENKKLLFDAMDAFEKLGF